MTLLIVIASPPAAGVAISEASGDFLDSPIRSGNDDRGCEIASSGYASLAMTDNCEIVPILNMMLLYMKIEDPPRRDFARLRELAMTALRHRFTDREVSILIFLITS